MRVAVLASGSGSNFAALLEAAAANAHPAYEVALLVTDRDGVGALARAEAAGVPARVVRFTGRDPDEVASELVDVLRAADIGAIFLAGFLRLVPAPVIEAWRGRIVNIHPALLPAFGGRGMWGRHVHEAVLASGCRMSGPTVHLVDERYDEGRILAQWPVPVRPDDTPESLGARVLAAEHRLYPIVAAHLCRALAEGRSPTPLSLSESLIPPPDPSNLS